MAAAASPRDVEAQLAAPTPTATDSDSDRTDSDRTDGDSEGASTRPAATGPAATALAAAAAGPAATGPSAAGPAKCAARPGSGRPRCCLGALRGLLTPAQWLYCAGAVLLELVLVWLTRQTMTSSPAGGEVWVYNIAHLMLVCLYPRAAAAPVAAGAAALAAPRGLGGGGRSRNFFLDGVKIFCTQLVLVHHISIGFGAMGGTVFALGAYPDNTFGKLLTNWLVLPNQSWFMCMLFFVGGIFVPSSLERKGLAEFVRDKLKRLGWPLVVTYFVVYPLSWGLWGVVLCEGGGGVLPHMIFSSGVTWFLATLLIFSISYTILPLPQVSIPMPSALQAIAACAALGAVQGWIYYCQFGLLNVGPVPCGGLPFDVAFFAAGCVARRSGWLDDIQSMAPRDYWLARLAALATVASFGAAATALGLEELVALRPGRLLLVGAWLGVMTGGIAVSVLHFFAVHCNFPSRWQRLASESQYAVYVLQTLTLPGVMYTLVLILRRAGYAVEFEFGEGSSPVSSSSELPQWVLVGGWAYTVVLVTVVAWPLGYLFRKLPLVNQVL